jgi:transposase
VSAGDRRVLEQMLESGSRRQAERAAIVLACAGGATNPTVAQELSVSRPTVSQRRSRFLKDRLDGLSDEPVRAGRSRSCWIRWKRS